MPTAISQRTVRRALLCLLILFLPALPARAARQSAVVVPAPVVALSTNAHNNIFPPGAQVAALVSLTNRAKTARAYTLAESVQDYTGASTSLVTTTVTLAPNQPSASVVPIPTHGNGYYELDVSLTDQATNVATIGTLHMAVMQLQGAHLDPTSAFGAAGTLTASPAVPQQLAATANAMAAAGVRYDREEFNWGNLERVPGSGAFDFSHTDLAMIAARNAGIQVLGLLDYWGNLPDPDLTTTISGTETLKTVTGCSKGPACKYTPQGDALFAKYAAAIVARYRPGGALAQQQGWSDGYGISDWEVWNEPTTQAFWRHDLADYGGLFAAMYQPAYAAIKGVDPSARVMYDESGTAIDTALGLTSANHEILAVHSYSGGLDPDTALAAPTLPRGGTGTAPAAISSLVSAGKPVWITETGYPTDGTVTYRQQAQYLVRSFVDFLAAGVMKEFWFKFHEDGPGEENLYNLVFKDETPKPSYVAYATMTHHLGGATFSQAPQMGSAIRADLFARTGSAAGSTDTVAVIWSTAEAGTITIPISGTAGMQLGAYDMMDNATGQRVSAGLTIPISNDPVYLEIPGLAPSAVALLIQAATIGGVNPVGVDPQLASGISNGLPDIHAMVTARTNVPISGTVTLQLPEGWVATPPSQRFPTLQPGQSAQLTYHLNAEVNHSGDAIGATASTPLGYTATGSSPVTPYALTYGHPQINGTLSSWAGASQADLVNLRPDQVVGIPGWTPQNISAHVYTMWDQTYFYLAAEVTDETFDYAPIGFNMYKGDSIQYGWGMDPDAYLRDSGHNRYNVTAGLTHQGPANFQYNLLAPWPGMQQDIRPDPATGHLIYTTAVPWANLGNYVPQAGKQFAFDLIINQNEKFNRIGWIQFTPGIGIGFRPSQFPLWTLEQGNPAAGIRLGGGRTPLQGGLTVTLPAAHGYLEVHDGGLRQIALTINGTAVTLHVGSGAQSFGPSRITTIDLSQYLHAGSNTIQATATPANGYGAGVLSFFQ